MNYVVNGREAMCLGAVALVVYSLACGWLIRFRRLPGWLSAGEGWVIWVVVAGALHWGFPP